LQNQGRILGRTRNTADTVRILIRAVRGRSNIDGIVNIISIRVRLMKEESMSQSIMICSLRATKEGMSAVNLVDTESSSKSSSHYLVGGVLDEECLIVAPQ
jgi:hypothetical protein